MWKKLLPPTLAYSELLSQRTKHRRNYSSSERPGIREKISPVNYQDFPLYFHLYLKTQICFHIPQF